MENKRLVELKKLPVILSIIFSLILYLSLLKYFNSEPNIESIKLQDFYLKYTMFSPIVFWVLSLFLFYFLLLIKFIFRLKSYIFYTIIYFLVYLFFLFLWIDLLFMEQRVAEFAILIIDTFWVPLIISSSFVLLLVLASTFKKLKTKK